LERHRKRFALWFADEQVNVFGHDNVSGDEESVPLTHSFQSLLEHVGGMRTSQQRVAMMTTEGYEVETANLLEALESPGHSDIVVTSGE
jgi:hypothetical protein